MKAFTVFLLLSHRDAYLIPKILRAELVNGWRFKRNDACLRNKKTKQVKFKHFATFPKTKQTEKKK